MNSRIDGEIMVAKYALDQKYHHHHYFCFNGLSVSEPELAGSPPGFLPPLVLDNNLCAITDTGFVDQMTLLPLSQQ